MIPSLLYHVLIVAAVPEERQSLRRLLAEAGLGITKIREAERAEDALALCRAEQLGCVLLDLSLPDLDLPMTLAALQSLHVAPVVLLAAPADEERANAALVHGAQDYLLKDTFSPIRLRRTLEQAAALAVGERPLRLALEAAQLTAWEWDVLSGEVTFSPLAGNAFQLVPGLRTSLHATIMAAIYPPDHHAQEQAIATALAMGGPFQLTVRVLTPEGQLRWHEVRGLVHHDAAGRPVRVFGATRDVSIEKRRAATEALHLTINQALLTTLTVEGALQLLARLSVPELADYCVIYLRDSSGVLQPILAFTGALDAPVLLAPLLPDALPLDEAYRLDEVQRTGHSQLLSAGAPALVPILGPLEPHSTMLIPLVVPGDVLGVLRLGSTASIRRYDADDLAMAEGLARHLAEALRQTQLQEAAQQALQLAARATSVLDAIITSATIGIGYLDQELRYRLVNPALATVNGLSPAEHMGRTLTDVLPTMGPRLEPLFRQVLETGEPLRELELRGGLCPQDGITHEWLLSCFLVPGLTPELNGVGMILTDISERKRTEAALRASEERFRLFAEHAQDVIYRYRFAPSLALEYLSPAIERMTGYPREAFYTNRELGYQLFFPEELPTIERIFSDSEAIPQLHIVRWHHRDGSIGWAELHSWLVLDEAGRPWMVEGIGRDITARKLAEDALQASEARYRLLFETMTQGVVYQDASGRVTAMNPAAERILQLSQEQLVGRAAMDPTWRMIREDGTAFSDDELPGTVALQTGEEGRLLVMGIRHPGLDTYRWLRMQSVPQFQAGAATLSHIYTIFEDITEQRQAARALEYERRQLDAIVRMMHDGLIAFYPDGRIVIINQAALALAGLGQEAPPATLEAMSEAAAVQLRDARGEVIPFATWLASPMLHGEVLADQEFRLQPRGEGIERWVAISGTTIDTQNGTPLLGIVTVRDVTQRKQAELALQAHSDALSKTNADLARALRLKDEFLAMMSHELRTPLNAVLGFTEALAEGIYGPVSDRQRQALAQIEQSGRHLLGILSDILDVTRIEAGIERLERVPLDVDELCRTAIQFVAEAAQQKDIRILRTVDYQVEGLRADKRRLTQILANLLDNAVKFTPAGGSVGLEVAANAAQEQIAFTVWDTGIGIAAGDLERLFRPFTQVDGKLNRAYDGIGMGLTLVRHLTALHGGSVQLESTPGVGSRFIITLPWSDADNSRPQPTLTPPAPSWLHPPHVLLADADEQTLTLYRDQLTRLGCTITTTRSGAEVLQRVRELQPDIVVLAIQLPELDGLAIMRRLRADADVSAIPVIAATALAMPDDRERGLAAGATRYLAKPVSGRTLIATIAEVLAAAGE